MFQLFHLTTSDPQTGSSAVHVWDVMHIIQVHIRGLKDCGSISKYEIGGCSEHDEGLHVPV